MEGGAAETGVNVAFVAPKKGNVETEPVKSSEQILSEAVKDPNKTADEVLDIFEKDYIPSLDVSHKFNSGDVSILLFTDLPKKVIESTDFDPKITDVKSSTDPKVEGFPEYVKLYIDMANERRDYRQYQKFPEDPRWARMWRLMGNYEQKFVDIIDKNPDLASSAAGFTESEKIKNKKNGVHMNFVLQYSRWVDEVKESQVKDHLVASGEWVGSGTFISNLEKMLEYGRKIKSANHVLNSNQSREDIQGDIKGSEAHQSSIFFYHWRKENYKNDADPVGYYGTKVDGKEIYSDISVFYPVDTIYRDGLTVGTNLGANSGSEFFVTKSPDVWRRPASLTSEQIHDLAVKDQTELSIDQAFFSVDDPNNYEKVKTLFSKFGYTEDWIKTHIYQRTGGQLDKVGIREWLKTRPYAKMEIPKMEPKVCYDGNAYLWEAAKKQ